MTVHTLLNGRRGRLVTLAFGAILAGGALTGCQASPPDLNAETAKQFQSTVLSVTQAVADGDLQDARDTLVAFDAALEKAAADGSVSFARHQRIDAALALVLADVDAALAAQAPAPEPEVVPAPVPEPEPTPEVTPEVTPDPVVPTAPVTDDPGVENGNNGNDNKDKKPKPDKGPKNNKSDD
ncbi:hypothetical protein [Mycetocola zhadangensis]|uniref:Mucin-associated surface protein n=1 Tax=Mycetocola zhadangensis TaxID=1164595 RepID=A0A3L7IS80_9MICO|nr:hypothetical protein [Mycetocola zhadangensis]RLQ81017.1 hypothetical protein D9V28_14800 [Mycetocola zhadangensis]GGF04001.1 hypothetical protein GCM10011313_28870 [Mycetocola zhadangensis]